jgi:hypothetical protein
MVCSFFRTQSVKELFCDAEDAILNTRELKFSFGYREINR